MAERILPHEETIKALNEKAKAAGDSFYLKVSRRVHLGSIPQQIASFSEAQVIHLVNPETWLPRIAGGGPTFILQAFHISEPAAQIGSPVIFSVATEGCPAKQIDPSVVRQAGWTGPPKLEWPKEEDMKAANAPAYSIASPLSPGISAAKYQEVPEGGGAAHLRDQERAGLHMERQRLERMGREFDERKHAAELEEIRRENDRRLKDMESRLLAAQPKMDIAQTIAAVLTASAPILQAMIQSSNETRIAMMKQQADSQMQQQTMLQAMVSRPAIDPMIEKAFDRFQMLLEKKSTEVVPQTQMLHSMAEAMGTMTSMTMDLVQTAAELNLGGRNQDDHPALKAIKEGVKAMNSLFAGYQTAAIPKQQQQQQQQALPAQAQAQAQATAQAQAAARAQLAQAAAQAQPTAHAQQGFAGAGDAPRNVVDRLEWMIKGKSDVSLVAKLFIDSLDDPDMVKALDEVEGDITELIARRISDWVMVDPANAEYLKRLLDEVNAQGGAAGIFEDEGGSDDEEDDS